jgi:LPXTG-motif cell wall-anchored protein
VDALDLTSTSAPNVSSLTIVTVTPENSLTQSDIDQLSEVSPISASAISQGDEVTIVLSGALAGNGPGLPGDQIIWTITLSNVGTDVITMTLVNQLGDELHLDSVTVGGGSISVDGHQVTITLPSLTPGNHMELLIETTILSSPVDSLISNSVMLEETGQSISASVRVVPNVTVLPQTGESSVHILSLSLAIGGLAVLLGLIILLKKRRTNQGVHA